MTLLGQMVEDSPRLLLISGSPIPGVSMQRESSLQAPQLIREQRVPRGLRIPELEAPQRHPFFF